MLSEKESHLYEYAVIRYVPSVEREEFINVGLVMMCKRRRWVRAAYELNRARLAAFAPLVEIEAVGRQLESFGRIAGGCCGPIGELDAHERFRWLTAVRSACVQTSRPHPGKCADLDETFARLYRELVE